LPRASDRTRRLRLFYETELRAVALSHGLVWTTEDVVGGAIWAPPDAWRVPFTASVREGPGMVRVFGRRLPLAFRARVRVEGRHPRKPPHWYLAIMAVAPECQGRGLGSKLMHPALETLDAEGTPAYLEASTVRSRTLYERHGFEVTGEFNVPSGGPTVWQMWREPG
jgi:ribosomal protein S18 acetylase RimI-like enzyme